jgi:hypothetical protein
VVVRYRVLLGLTAVGFFLCVVGAGILRAPSVSTLEDEERLERRLEG